MTPYIHSNRKCDITVKNVWNNVANQIIILDL